MVVKKKTMRRRSVRNRNYRKSRKRNVRKSVRRNVQKSVRRNVRKSSKRNVRKSVRRMSSKRNVRKSVRGGTRKYADAARKYAVHDPSNIPIDTIVNCLSNLKLTGNDFSTGKYPGVISFIRGGGDFTDILNISSAGEERRSRGNQKERVEEAHSQIYRLIKEANRENKNFINIKEIEKVLLDIPKAKNFIKCLRSSQTSEP